MIGRFHMISYGFDVIFNVGLIHESPEKVISNNSVLHSYSHLGPHA